ncbi:hypothetical protein EF808_04630 [archaeon]|nr:MAG: hypothetical protein EF808_04630 [archaeon]
MAIVGVRIDKIEASRNNQTKVDGSVRIGSSPRILSITENQVPSATGKMNVLEVGFEYFINYDPALGSIRIDGAVLAQEKDERKKKVLNDWKSERKLPQDFSTEILKQLTQRSMLISMLLAREMGLPSPLPLRISQQEAASAQEPTQQ